MHVFTYHCASSSRSYCPLSSRPVLIFHAIDFTGRNGSSGTQGEKLFLVALLLSNMRVMEVLEIYIALLSVNCPIYKNRYVEIVCFQCAGKAFFNWQIQTTTQKNPLQRAPFHNRPSSHTHTPRLILSIHRQAWSFHQQANLACCVAECVNLRWER